MDGAEAYIVVSRELRELATLKDGWYDGAKRAALVWLSWEFSVGYGDGLPTPNVYPTVAGGVRLEWLLGDVDVSLEVDLAERTADYHSLNLATDEGEGRTLTLGAWDARKPTEDWEWLNGKLRGYYEAAMRPAAKEGA